MKRITLMLLTLMLCHVAWAVRALPVRKTVTMLDGTQAEVILKGDEHFHFYQTLDGRRGQLTADGRFKLYTKTEFDAVNQAMGIRRAQANRRRIQRLGEPGVTTGQHHGLVILVTFSDLDFTLPDANATYKRFFNEVGYSDYGMAGSVHDYFYAQSYGLLDLTFDVYGPVKLSRSYAYYGRNNYEGKDVNVHAMIKESVLMMDDQIDFTNYDWDHDGTVDQMFFVYAGYNEAQGAEENTIWPHESNILSANLVLDGVQLATYGCSSELRGASGASIDGVGTACHEFTHCLGLPDMYDTSSQGTAYGMASWDLMSAGNYNDGSRTPAGFTAYERWVSGWMEPTELADDLTRVSGMKPLQEKPEAYVLYNVGNPDEYYLLENRQPVGWDKALPGHGLLITHVDFDATYWGANSVNANANHQRVTVVPADNNTVENYSGMAGDPYPGTSGNHSLTNYTTPAATLFNRNTDRTLFLSKPIENIQESSDGLISFVALHPELAVPEAQAQKIDDTSFVISWEPVEWATMYELQLTETPASRHDIEECLILEEHFAKCVTKSAGFSDISSKLSSYLSNTNWSGSKLYTSPKGLRFGTSSEAGYLRTSGYQVPESGEVTLVMDVEPFAEGTPVKGEVRFVYDGQWSSYKTESIAVDKAGRYLLHCKGLSGIGAIDLRPESRLYITYMALYEGYWTEEELADKQAKDEDIAHRTAQVAPRRISTRTETLTATSFRVENANPTSTYTYSLRALTDEGITSQWSEESTFSFDGTAILSPTEDAPTHSGLAGQWFNLSGQRVARPAQRGIYIRGGKKTILR